MEPAAALLEEPSAAVAADGPSGEGTEQVAEGSGERNGDEGAGALGEGGAEEGGVLGEGSRGERAADEHHELARGGEDGVDGHQQKDCVNAVGRDEARHV